MRDASVAINLVGILAEGGAQSFDAVQAKGAATVAKAASAVGARMVHVSAIGADENSLSSYGRSKAAGEKAVLAAVPSATILRPSVVFGPEDQFTNRFAALARMSPVLPLIGGGVNKMQPVYVGDVATAVADAVDGKTKPGATYELGGPEVLSLREIIEIILAITERQPMLVPLPFGLGKTPGAVPAIRAGRAKTDAGPGGAAAIRQRGVGCGESRWPDAGRARDRARFDGSDRPAISLAFSCRRAISEEERLGVRRTRHPEAARHLRRASKDDWPGACGHPSRRARARTYGDDVGIGPYRPSASAIRPSVPTMTRHQAKNVKPWRVT